MNSDQKKCSSCDNWLVIEEPKGECRSHSPQALAVQEGNKTIFETIFPQTIATDWCGDFKKVN